MTSAEITHAEAVLNTRAQVRINGFALEGMGADGQDPDKTTQLMDRAASVFRSNLEDYWTYEPDLY